MKYTKAQLIARGFTEGSIASVRCPRCGEHLIGQKDRSLVCVNCARRFKGDIMFKGGVR